MLLQNVPNGVLLSHRSWFQPSGRDLSAARWPCRSRSCCLPLPMQYTSRAMHRRLLAIALILTAIFQGPALAYASTLGAGMGDAITHACGGQLLADGNDCQSCCSHGATPSCAAQCPVPVSAAVSLALPIMRRTALRGIIVPEVGIDPFAEHNPPHPLRPPIV